MSNISYKHFIYDHELMLYPYAPIGLLHNKGEWPQPEYNLSIVISASFEDMNIIEWISYHLALGVDHIYLYCTDEDPTDLYHKVIAFTLGKKPSITFNHYRFSKSIAPIYFHFIRNYLHKTKWYIHLEITDYLYIHEKQTLQLFLESFNDTNVICFNMILYNNLKQEEVKSIKTIFSKTKPINFPFIFTKLMVRSKACPYQYIFENLNKRIDYHIPNQSLIDHSRNVLCHSMQTYYDDFPHNALKSLNSNTQAQISNTAYIAHFCQSDDTQETIDNLSLLYTNEKTTLKLQSNASSATPHSTPDKYWIKILKNLWKNSFLPAPTPLITVLSNNKPCNQSSAPKQTIPETFAISLIKGQLKGVTQTITHKETDPWWEIDLEKSYIVKNIRLYNGIDLNIKNANHFIIESSENHQIWIKRHQKTTSNLFGGSDGTYYNWIHPLGIKARWIRITIPGNNQIFSLDQIEILGMEHKIFIFHKYKKTFKIYMEKRKDKGYIHTMYKKISLFTFLFIIVSGVILYYRYQARIEHGAYAALQSGYLNLKNNKKLQAMGDFSYLIDFYGKKSNTTVQEIVAEAMLKKAEVLVEVKNVDDAIITLEQLSNLYLKSTSKKLQFDVAQALYTEGSLLLQQEQYEPAMITLSHLVSVYGQSKNIEVRRMVAEAMFKETEILNHWGKTDTALNIHSSIIEQFIKDKDPEIRLITAKSVMARTANRLNNKEWGLALYNSNVFIKIFEHDTSPVIKEFLAHNLLYRAEILHRVKDIPEEQKDLFGKDPQSAALKTYDELLSLIVNKNDEDYPRYKAAALLGKAQIFLQNKKYTDALVLCNQIYETFSESDVLKIKDIVARSLLTKAQILAATKQDKQALVTYNLIIQSYHYDDNHYSINSVLISAYNECSALLEQLNDNDEALKLLDKAITTFQGTHNENIYYQVSEAYMAMAALQVKMKLYEKAVTTYTSLIAVAHHKTLPSIRYNGALAIVKKAQLLIQLEKGVEIKQTYDLLTNFYKDDKNIKVREIVAQGMYGRAKSLFEHNRGYTAVDIIKQIFHLFKNDKTNPTIHAVLEKTKDLQKQLGSTIVW